MVLFFYVSTIMLNAFDGIKDFLLTIHSRPVEHAWTESVFFCWEGLHAYR